MCFVRYYERCHPGHREEPQQAAGQDRMAGVGGGLPQYEDGLGLHQDARALRRGNHK